MEVITRHILIPDQQLEYLNKDVYSDRFVNAFISVSGKKKPIKIRYRGGHTRNYPKKSYDMILNGKRLHLNAEYDDPSFLRNALSFQFFRWIGVPSPKTKHILLRLNGEEQGVYLQIESVDRRFFQRRKIPVQALFYAVNDNANFSLTNPDTGKRKRTLFDGYEQIIGNATDRRHLKTFISRLNHLPESKLRRFLGANVDIDNYLRWLAGAVLTGNYDGFEQNYAIYRHRTQKLYRMIPWDYEGTWGRNCFGKRCESSLVRITGYNQLTKAVLSVGSYRKRYKKILHDILQHYFTVNRIERKIEEILRNIDPFVCEDWNKRWSYDQFTEEPRIIHDYISERREIIKDALHSL